MPIVGEGNKELSNDQYSYYEDNFEKYEEETKIYADGYFILFDIIDSTKRKDYEKYRWISQTILLYRSVGRLKKKLEELPKLKNNTSFLKTVGDSAFIFIPTTSIDDTISNNILESVREFNGIFNNKVEITGQLRLKIVLTYLKDVFLYKEEKSDQIKDVIGKDIDFSFRIEKFAKDTHLILNEDFADHCEVPNGYNKIAIKRKLKGWDEEQLFYALYRSTSTLLDSIVDSIILSNEEDNIYIDILKNEISKGNINQERGKK